MHVFGAYKYRTTCDLSMEIEFNYISKLHTQSINEINEPDHSAIYGLQGVSGRKLLVG